MKNLFTVLTILLCCCSAFAQRNEMPDYPLNKPMPWIVLETGSSYIIPSQITSVRQVPGWSLAPSQLSLNKCDYTTRKVSKTVIVAGDTTGTDSVVEYYAYAAVSGNRIAIAFNKTHPNDFYVNGLHSSLWIAVYDTSLNLIKAPTRLKLANIRSGERFVGCTLQSIAMNGNRIVIGYTNGDSSRNFSQSELPKYILLDGDGNILRDSIAGTTPSMSPNAGIYRQLAEIVAYPGNKFLITGKGLHTDNAPFRPGYVIADSNMRPVDSGAFSFSERFTPNYQEGYFPQFGNAVALPGGNLIFGRDFIPDGQPTGSSDLNWLALLKLSANDSFKTTRKVLFKDPEFGWGHNSNTCLQSLAFNPRDNRIYYALTDMRSPGFGGDCKSGPNKIQVFCLDTNLNLLWHKYIQPFTDRCYYVSRTTSTGSRNGFTILGYYTDVIDPREPSQFGYFLYHLDSTGALDVPSSKLATARDRIMVHPNPTSDRVTISDLGAQISSVIVYNAAGQRVQEQRPGLSASITLSLGAYPAGLYLIECRTADGMLKTMRVRND